MMESIIRETLKCTTVRKRRNSSGGGCISNAYLYQADDQNVFVKTNKEEWSLDMFRGEEASLKAISLTKTVRVPSSIAVFEIPTGGSGIIMEYLDLTGLNRKAALLGDLFARMHLHNIMKEKELKKNKGRIGLCDSAEGGEAFISKFGFPVTTHCGKFSQTNDWCDDWSEFYCRKIDHQISLLQRSGERKAAEMWSALQNKVPNFFKDVIIRPSLLHGDLWSGNVGEANNEPVIFDPASFYGHHEYDLALAAMFGGFPRSFWDSYHALIPRESGWKERHELYKLFHYLNHWNHFGCGYKMSSLETMKSLLKV